MTSDRRPFLAQITLAHRQRHERECPGAHDGLHIMHTTLAVVRWTLMMSGTLTT
jgi:hypothetical protein